MNRVFGGRPMRSFMEIDDIGGGYKRGSTRRFSADRFAGGLNRKREGDLIQKVTATINNLAWCSRHSWADEPI